MSDEPESLKEGRKKSSGKPKVTRATKISKVLISRWTLLIGLLFIFFGFFILVAYPPQTLFMKLVVGFPIEVGFAFVIAWVVGITVEQQARKELSDHAMIHANEISQNVFKYLYCVDLPRPVFDLVEEHIFKSSLIKTRQSIKFVIHERIDADWLIMKCEFDYTLKNIGIEDENFDIKFHASKVSGLHEPEGREVGLKTLIVDGDPIPRADFPRYDFAVPDEIGQKKYKINRRIAPGAELRVRIEFDQFKRVCDNDLFQSNSICLKSEFSVSYNPREFNVFWEAIHPSNKFSRETSNCPSDSEKTVLAEINDPLLPKNGVFIWWNEVPEDRV